ncbi:MAG: diacylglycerol kinase [Tepidanaerobacteraceae bacterium]|jgi:diacylglycerol kinase (ATP)|nr:diacylglycerol kinase [Bacillota bacterium]
MKRSRTLLESFMYAISGILYTLRTQRNIRIHFLTTILVLLLSWLMNLRALELLLVIVAITLVIVAEMINTAIETVVDMYTKEYHPLAEVAKNVAAGAVLITVLNAIVIGYYVFLKKLPMSFGFLK